MIQISAFAYQGQPEFYDAITGNALPSSYTGFCQVTMKDGEMATFKTGINQYFERYWLYDGNNPPKPKQFISYQE